MKIQTTATDIGTAIALRVRVIGEDEDMDLVSDTVMHLTRAQAMDMANALVVACQEQASVPPTRS